MQDLKQGFASATTIDEVLERMATVDAALPATDGVATFNRMYREVTNLVNKAVDAERFVGGEFLERLDVHFANLYLAAYQADATGEPVPRAWAPLFEHRNRPRTHPVQFALAGMNAHISHDLAFAVVTTCQEIGKVPEDDTPEHTDFTETNKVLEDASEEIKEWFNTGIVAMLDDLSGKLDDAFAMFAMHVAREAAWETAEMIHNLTDNPRMHKIFTGGLVRTVEFTSRGILL